jgi:hypothetical protein
LRLFFGVVIAALLVVPSFGVADPIREAPRPEELVEGHTVFLTIDAYQFDPGSNDTAPALAGPTAPSLTPEAQGVFQQRWERYAGVLWFNDQYLSNADLRSTSGFGAGETMRSEYAAALAVLVRADDGRGIREPCGGAVLAVNAGDPDPRMLMASIDGSDPVTGDSSERAVIGVKTGEPDAFTDGPILAPFEYMESYRLTDPNGHAWIIDKYLATVRIGLSEGIVTSYAYPVWVANILGTPSFVPDADPPTSDDSCVPFKDLTDGLEEPAVSSTCALSLSGGNLLGTHSDSDVALDLVGGSPAWTDDPCMGSMQPSRAGFCYNGRAGGDIDLDGDIDANDCVLSDEYAPRCYHALFYFSWEDLTISGSPRDHSDPFATLDTNGCQSGTEWPCPGEEPWSAIGEGESFEGNSHSSHPSAPVHEERSWCPPVGGINPTNHGGSLGGRRGGCDYTHATALVDVYFSGSGRPAEPVERAFVIEDAEGSSAPYADFHTAYQGMP